MSGLRGRLERLEGGGRRGGVYVVRTDEDEREARAHAARRGDALPILIARHTPPLDEPN